LFSALRVVVQDVSPGACTIDVVAAELTRLGCDRIFGQGSDWLVEGHKPHVRRRSALKDDIQSLVPAVLS